MDKAPDLDRDDFARLSIAFDHTHDRSESGQRIRNWLRHQLELRNTPVFAQQRRERAKRELAEAEALALKKRAVLEKLL